ncbi:MAG: serine/threonine-protein kinase [Phycisphaerales bacterium]
MRITKGNPEIRVDRRRSEDDRVGEGYHAARRVLASLAPTTPTSLTPPGYQLLDTLGVGGGGATFLALREGSDRPVALKVLHAHAAPGPTRQRAWRELDLLQDTHLPCLPRLLDYGVTGDRLFIATEFVSGQRLDEHARNMPPSRDMWNQLAETLARVADAVHSLNERGIIHRDLKPSNILIASDGSPFIIDLGVAALAARDAAETLTADGVPIGTPAFMSPEQARGERELISIRSDVYALGATACVVLTGRTPHDLEGVSLHEAVRRVGSEPARDARALEPELPRALAAIVAKACAAHPHERYATAAELAEDLRRFVRREPVLATRPGAWQRAVRWVGKHPVAATAILCAGMVLGTAGAAAIGVWWARSRPQSITIDGPSGTIATLRSVTNEAIFEWKTSPGGTVHFAALTEPRGLFGRDRLAIVARMFDDHGRIVHRLTVSRAEAPGDVLWSTPIEPPEIRLPPGTENWIEDSPPEKFRCRAVVFDDIMVDRPGQELAVILNHDSKSPSCIRVYSLEGQVIWEGWHNGRLNDLAFMRGSGLLVCAGVTDSPRLSELGIDGGDRQYPPVIFAFRPHEESRPTSEPTLVNSWAVSPSDLVSWCISLPAAISANVSDVKFAAAGNAHLRVALYAAGQDSPRPIGSFDLAATGAVEAIQVDDWFKTARPDLASDFIPRRTHEFR